LCLSVCVSLHLEILHAHAVFFAPPLCVCVCMYVCMHTHTHLHTPS
jgi:hypothetical protein